MTLCAVGDLVEDVVVWLDAPPRRGTDRPAVIHRRRGGSAANVAAFAAAAGHAARFVGQVGDDDLGERLVRDLASAGVDVRVRRQGRTGTVVVLVEPGGERWMLPDRGAAPDLDAVPDGSLDGVTVLHLPAYSLLSGALAGACTAAAAAVRSAGGLVSVDASSSAVLAAHGPRRVLDLLSALAPDVLLAAADEAEVLDCTDVVPPGVGLVVVKDGPRPVRLLPAGGPGREVPVRAVAATDATGAGDAFAAGFLPALAAGVPPADAAAAGIALARRVLAEPGAALGGSAP